MEKENWQEKIEMDNVTRVGREMWKEENWNGN